MLFFQTRTRGHMPEHLCFLGKNNLFLIFSGQFSEFHPTNNRQTSHRELKPSNLCRDGVYPALLNTVGAQPQFILCCSSEASVGTPFQADHIWSQSPVPCPHNLLHSLLLSRWHLRTRIQNTLFPNLERTIREKQSWRFLLGVIHHVHVV